MTFVPRRLPPANFDEADENLRVAQRWAKLGIPSVALTVVSLAVSLITLWAMIPAVINIAIVLTCVSLSLSRLRANEIFLEEFRRNQLEEMFSQEN